MKGGDRYVYRHLGFSCSSCIWLIVILRQIQKADSDILPAVRSAGQLPDRGNLSDMRRG